MSLRNLRTELDRVLAEAGFSRHELTWNRNSSDVIEVLDLQLSRDQTEVTMNVGVLVPAVHETCWGEPVPSLVDEEICTVRARIGYIEGDTDRWWQVGDDSIAEDMVQAARMRGLPFVESMHDPAAMRRYLARSAKFPPESVYLAILRHLGGDPVGGCISLREIQTRLSGGWHDRLVNVKRRLSCPE